MDAKQFRALIYHCFLMEKNTVQVKAWLDKRYLDSPPPKATVERWFANFKGRRANIYAPNHSGRPIEMVTPKNIRIVHKIILTKRNVRFSEITDTLRI